MAGGSERQMLLLARELRASHDVSFFVMLRGGLFADRPAEIGVEVHHLGWPQRPWRESPVGFFVAVVRAYVRYVRLARTVDVVDAWLPSAYALAGLAQPFASVPVLVAGRRSMWARLRAAPSRRRHAAALAMRFVDAVVANSQAVARAAIAREGLTPAAVHVIPNGIDLPDLAAETSRAELRRSLGVSDDCLLIGSVANYRPAKGVEAIVDLAHRLRLRSPHLRYVVVGEGPLRTVLERQIAILNLSEVLTLAGAHYDAQLLYPAFDIVVHTSESEGFPNVILEAAAWGRPIVATDVGGTREIVRDGQEALLVPARDPVALDAAVTSLVESPELRARLGLAARSRAAEFTAERLGSRTAELYATLFAASRRRRA